ncbi:MAG: type II toxin-antitoxin system ParD family antitoxin [Planctomycetota bacterium]|nr:type II toxin-antitoxin system ParD family antitoxin [Planctomycetaceae bacterium]MDQ3331028.1 type II toxin-antitoxin system ParD family antitoxin [Planctomycetota bacterium]
MPYKFPSDVQELVSHCMAGGDYASEDDVLREALRALTDEEEHLRFVRDAVAERQAGDEGVPLEDAFASIRSKYAVTPET